MKKFIAGIALAAALVVPVIAFGAHVSNQAQIDPPTSPTPTTTAQIDPPTSPTPTITTAQIDPPTTTVGTGSTVGSVVNTITGA